ncbi:uridine kinase [Rhizoctonia solani AG-1 IB]|uniref:Uridine kinase n=1 Tax=Thanatephorus cucumeris (strain AG1-IB / isolate 7/3/14) TaxID=1108050 RepID=A0A0B7FF65_THACB|nr:uridine kinase [Rhizoctonia solani AG-1 IB]
MALRRPTIFRTHTSQTPFLNNVPLTANGDKNKLLVSHGRPPWYGQDGKPLTDAFVIGIAGGSASGKTHVAQEIVRSLDSIPSVVIMSQDSFYKEHTAEELELAFANQYDFDHPDAIDMPLFAQCLRDLKECKQANMPIYSFTEHQRMKQRKYLYGANIVIVEGIMALQDPQLRDLYDVKIFVQCDSDLMLARRIKRDVAERGRSVDGILEQYLRFVKPAYDHFVAPTARYADIIVPGVRNAVAIDLITTHVRKKLSERSFQFRDKLARADSLVHIVTSPTVTTNATCNLIVLPQTPQLRGIYTILRDKETSREDFIFYADRLATLICEKAMEVLPFKNINVSTPTGAIADGKDVDMDNPIRQICSVTIVRAGGMLEMGLRRVMRDIAIGSLLIQSDPSSGEPMLLHSMLPFVVQRREESKDAWVFLLDAQIGTGAAALMAIRVLLDHGVAEDHIVFVTFLGVPRGGMAVIRKTFPGIRFVCGAVDDGLEEAWLHHEDGTPGRRVWSITPGMGNIGDRYYM